MDFLEDLQHRVLLADGAMGTELMATGIAAGQCLEALNMDQPDLVRAVHDRYIAAGARVIETNSFGANAVRLAAHGHEHQVNEINWTAAQLAKEAAKGTGVYVAGSVGPLGITAEQAAAQGIDRHNAFMEQIGALLDGGCNFIILETFLDVEELLIAINAKHTLHHCPVVAMMPLQDPAQFAAAAAKLRSADADIIGINCVSPTQALQLLQNSDLGIQDSTLAAFPSAGLPVNEAGRLSYPVGPEEFARTGLALASAGVRFIGGCCGTGPTHIAALAKALESLTKPSC